MSNIISKTPIQSNQSGDFRQAFTSKFKATKAKFWQRKDLRLRLHSSFRLSHREDYQRSLEIPGLLHHAAITFKLIFRHWRIFLPFILAIVLLNVVLVGLMSEETYLDFQSALDQTSQKFSQGELGNFAKSGLLLLATITTGGLTRGMSEVQQVFVVILFLIVWLVTIYLLRHLLAGHQVKLRDGFYNALTPLISSFLVFLVLVIQSIPIFIVIITYSAAVATEFLATPFYALVYFIFASLLVLLSAYLLSSSFLGLVAVTAPGLYPLAALRTASDLILGRRIKLLIRLLHCFLVISFCLVVVMLPLILLDLWLKQIFSFLAGIPFVSFFLLVMVVFSVVYFTAYFYLFYRQLLDYRDEF